MLLFLQDLMREGDEGGETVNTDCCSVGKYTETSLNGDLVKTPAKNIVLL